MNRQVDATLDPSEEEIAVPASHPEACVPGSVHVHEAREQFADEGILAPDRVAQMHWRPSRFSIRPGSVPPLGLVKSSRTRTRAR